MKTRYLIGILSIGIFLSSNVQGEDWELHAISGEVVAGETFILLTWTAKEGVAGFNLYRKESVSAPYQGVPLNSSSISVMTDCNEIEKIIPPHSTEWEALSHGLTDSIGTLFNPCQVASISDTSQAYQRLQALAHAYWKIAIVMGQAYVDSNVTVGTTYWYEVRGVDKLGAEIGILDTDVQIEAGAVISLPAPTKISAEPGDCKVQITWPDVEGALGYDIFRKRGIFPIKINESAVVIQCTTNLAGETIDKANCFVDFQRWDEAGDPDTHLVDGKSVDGPYNGTTYYYQVRARDIFGRPGASSSLVSATPFDSTSPAVPYDVSVEDYKDGLQAKWLQVTHDAKGHRELSGIQGYRVYRFNSADSLSDSVVVSSLVLDTFGIYPLFKDTDPILRSDYGEKDYWYRVRCIDNIGNISPLSSAAGGHLPDTTSPHPPENLSAIGHADYIELEWEKPSSAPPDLAGYMIYRSICDRGVLGGDSVCVDSVCKDSVFIQRQEEWKCKKWECKEKGYLPYPFNPIANIDNPDTTYYKDRTVPEDSPICYGYTVKAYDRSQNLSDTSNIVCQRLREETPPPPPIISSLKARNRAIRVEWVSPPVQDLFGFIVERSETGAAPWIQVSDTLEFEEFGCEDIPATNIEVANTTFSFLDTTVVPKTTYWYRVRAADYGKNIGDSSVSIETYTYDITGPPEPINLAVVQPSGECALKITWEPSYDTTYLGFVVFRSRSADKGYRQISKIITGNEFIDNKVVANRWYWYKIQYFAINGNRSLVSDSKKGKVMP